MAETIYNDSWSPSNIKCDWKPEKLGRYSFVNNLIDYESENNKLNYEQKEVNPTYNSETNLTSFIHTSSEHKYLFRCTNSNIKRGIKSISYFYRNQYNHTDQIISNNGLFGEFIAPSTTSNSVSIKITIYKEAWGYINFYDIEDLDGNNKNINVLNVVDNIAGTKIYEDLNFEVFVKSEAIIKNFVDKFNLTQFQNFVKDKTGDNTKENLISYANTKGDYFYNYYGSQWREFQPNHNYNFGDVIVVFEDDQTKPFCDYVLLICNESHTSPSSWREDTKFSYFGESNLGDCSPLLYITKQINESNYQQFNFPYVASLLFKDLWYCDRWDSMRIVSKYAYFTTSYNEFFTEELRESLSLFDKFYDQGIVTSLKLNIGESFLNDDDFGISNLEKNFKIEEYNHSNEDWDIGGQNDEDNINFFDKKIKYPYNHFYNFLNYKTNYFKNKEFSDCTIDITLKKEDKLGNVYQRLISLPIYISFFNNLIKAYNWSEKFVGTKYIDEEIYLENYSSPYKINYYGDSGEVTKEFIIWCPDVKKLSLSSTFNGTLRITQKPQIVDNMGLNTIDGQLCLIRFKFNKSNSALDNTLLTIILEYSDGINYDRKMFLLLISKAG